MTVKKKTLKLAIDEIFDSGDVYTTKQVYAYVIEFGCKDRGDITKHSIRGQLHKMLKAGKLIHISKTRYRKTHDS